MRPSRIADNYKYLAELFDYRSCKWSSDYFSCSDIKMFFQYMLAGVVMTLTTVILYFKWSYTFWKRRGIPYITPSFPTGTVSIRKGFNRSLQDAHKELKSKREKFGGVFVIHKPILLIVDPDVIKRMLSTDFQHFVNHGSFVDEKREPFNANLFNLEDERWKNMRAKLTPTFTSGKMKFMYQQIMSSAEQMVEHIRNLSTQNKVLNVKEITSCYSIDIIGSCVFGLECNSFKNPDAEFRKFGLLSTEVNFSMLLRMLATFILPEIKKFLPIRTLRRDVEEFFVNAFKQVLEHRKTTDFKRNDFVQILLELSAGHNGNTTGLTMEEMLAQSIVFFAAGFETSSINLAMALYELSLREDLQEKLRSEISEAVERNNGELTYELLMDMKYLDQVVNESLRLYPPLPFLNRICNMDYIIPGTDAKIEKGTSVMINIMALHKDPEYFPDPEKFDPDRFSKENKPSIRPFTFLPFGDGPRICIGQRFAILQNKIGLAILLKNFKILPDKDTPKSITLNPKSLTTVPTKPVMLRTQLL